MRRVPRLAGLGDVCDGRLQQPVVLIRRPQIRDVKAAGHSAFYGITFLRSSSQGLSQAAVLSLIFNRSSHLLVVCEIG